MSAKYWIDVALRIPIILLLDNSLGHLGELLPFSFIINGLIQIICVAICLCFLITTYEQLFSVYYYAVFVLHIAAVIYHICNTPLLINNNIPLSELITFSVIISYSPVMLAWVIFAVTIVMYSLVFHSVKPALFSMSMIPVYVRYLKGVKTNPTFVESIAFGITIFIFIQTIQQMITNLIELARYQIRIGLIRFRMYGSLVLFVLHWRRLRLNSVLTFYWILAWNFQMVVFTIFIDERFDSSFILACTAYACNSFIKVASFCFVIQHIVKVILHGVKQFVKDNHTFVEEGQHQPNGLRESIGFLFLSLYTSLTTIDPSKRIVLLELIFLLLLSALIRSVFEIIEPYLLALNGGINHPRRRHVKLVTICLCLISFAVYMGIQLYYLREKIPFSIPNMITVAQIVSALVLYFLYLYNTLRETFWDELDDYVYIIKGTCRTFEFVLIVLVLGYRVLDTSSRWTVFQITMVILHLYVNVYLSLKDGWKSIQLRRLVSKKLDILPKASQERLDDTEDVCPICLEQLNTARITPCNHLFHTLCLKKWLNVQNKCPLCHATILNSRQ